MLDLRHERVKERFFFCRYFKFRFRNYFQLGLCNTFSLSELSVTHCGYSDFSKMISNFNAELSNFKLWKWMELNPRPSPKLGHDFVALTMRPLSIFIYSEFKQKSQINQISFWKRLMKQTLMILSRKEYFWLQSCSTISIEKWYMSHLWMAASDESFSLHSFAVIEQSNET